MKSGRPRKFDEQEVLSRVMNSFWEHGFRDATFEQLVSDSGLSRSSLYNTFGGKEALFDKAMQLYLDNKFADLKGRLNNTETSENTLDKFVDVIGERYDPNTKDCLLRKTILQNAASTEEPKESGRLKRYFQDIWHALSSAMKDAADKKPEPLTIEERSALLVAARFGSAAISRSGGDDALLQALKDGAGKLAHQATARRQ